MKATWTHRLIGGWDGISKAMDECRHVAQTHDVPPNVQRDVVVSLEEIVTNVLRHGADGARVPAVELCLEISQDVLSLAVLDDGPAFDPLSVDEPARDQPLDTRPVGGLGILLIKRLMDDVAYTREGERNRLEIRKRFEPGG